MNYFLFLFINMFTVFQEPDSLISVPDLKAFTHTEFFFSKDCKCGMFNPEFFQLEVYNAPNKLSNHPYNPGNTWIIPSNFEVGHSVIITGIHGDFFRIKFKEDEHPICYNCQDSVYYVKKGTLGTWIYNYNKNIEDFDLIPLYEKPDKDSKIITKIKKENSVAIILDIKENWMLIETISKKRKKRGWLDPSMQCGNPYGIDAGLCW